MNIEEATRQFWSASFFWRRAQGRDTGPAVDAIKQIAAGKYTAVADRAKTTLREIENADNHPPRSG